MSNLPPPYTGTETLTRSARRSIALYKWWYVKPAPKLDVRKVSKIATDLHRRMYEQFAA